MIRRFVAVVAVALSSAVVPAACSDDPPPSSSPHDAVVEPGGDAAHLPPVPELSGAVGAVADATFDHCATTPGPHVVRGKVENSTNESVTYVVAVSWIDQEADVVQRGVVRMSHVAPGGSADFIVTAEVPDGVSSCTYYVVRTPGD